MRYYRRGRAVELAFLDDYAFTIMGLLDLYEASFETKWLIEAKTLAEEMIKLFADNLLGKGRFNPTFVDDNQAFSFFKVQQLDCARNGGFVPF